ncbi:CYFA0S01e00628g1_1 [Cyberlindnera fabianii]|uniref:Anaphase-promoting complex subunit 11 n=1 Tax=Cyberlindnera fabianii TaxID=36022 RepID=A0A061AFG3_CYBFA|nr:CYFA0S01e00628g1_1 [Cyberlindnera fabianii]
MKVHIKSWKGVATWSWDVPKEEVCGICRVSFDGTCPTCKYPGDECPLVVGECTHRFHVHCISKWLNVETSKNLCPMCRRRFQTKQDETIKADTSSAMGSVVQQGGSTVLEGTQYPSM